MIRNFSLLRFVLLLSTGAVLMFSCKKTDDIVKSEVPDPAITNFPVNGFDFNDGVIAAVKTREYFHTDTGEAEFDEDRAYAFFYSKPGMAPFIDAGKVKVDSVTLQLNAETGVYEISQLLNPFGYTFGSTVGWSVSGNNKNEINGFNYSMDAFPLQPIIDTNVFFIKKDTTFTLKMLNLTEFVPDDTTLNFTYYYKVFTITQGDQAISHRINYSSTEYTFPIDEVKKFKAGPAEIQVAAYKFRKNQIASKAVNVVNGSMSYRVVEIID